MSIVLRCSECSRYYALSNENCPACGHGNQNRQYHIRYDGKAVYAGNSLRIAREMEAKMKTDKRLGRISEYNKPKDLLFTEFIEKYYKPHYKNKKSARSIGVEVKFFLGVLKDKTLRGITPADIEQAVNLKSSKKPATRDHCLAIVRRIMNYAVELEMLEKSPVKMKLLKIDNTRHRYLTDEEANRLLAACAESKSESLYPVVLIALHTGMRLGEILSLKRTDIVDGKFYIKSTHTKNSKVKIVPINKTLSDYFEKYFITHDDFNFKRCTCTYAKIIKKCGIEDFHFHDLRHTFASKLKANNINDSVIQKLMGLETPSMVQRYAHLSPESILKAIEVVEYTK
ncbi:MAG: site-specific integrase [Deferribacteraceae bacterium]|nr:site-specific integrase [Deferribacteraceae bacterium]